MTTRSRFIKMNPLWLFLASAIFLLSLETTHAAAVSIDCSANPTLTEGSSYQTTDDVTLTTGGTCTLTKDQDEAGADVYFQMASLTINTGVTLTHATNGTTASHHNELDIHLTGDLTISGTGSINVAGKGYKGGAGTGYGYTVANSNSSSVGSFIYQGASHGGRGGRYDTGRVAEVFDDYANPVYPGGGGGSNNDSNMRGMNGGGVVRIQATNITVNGTINADGEAFASSYYGGGAGGTVYLNASGTLSGSGTLSANGTYNTTSNYGGGGGGIISLHYGTDSSTITTQAFGGNSGSASSDGSAGFIYKKPSGSSGSLTIDNNSAAQAYYATAITSANDVAIATLTIKNKANLNVESSAAAFTVTTLDVQANSVFNGDLASALTLTTLTSASGATVDFAGNATVTTYTDSGATNTFAGDLSITTMSATGTVTITGTFTAAAWLTGAATLTTNGTTYVTDGTVTIPNGQTWNANSTIQKSSGVSITAMTIQSGGILTHTLTNTTADTYKKLEFTINGDLTIDSGGKIDVTGKGYNGGGATGYGYTNGNINNSGVRSFIESGGSHGGKGGYSGSGSSVAEPYDSIVNPTLPGGGGGGNNGTTNRGMHGGGVARVTATNITVNGSVLANGETYSDFYYGGGAGGSIYLYATSTFSGTGTVNANGTVSSSAYGGGGGGRIAVYFSTDSSGLTSLLARGGNSSAASEDGSAGTIYKKDNDLSSGTLIMDNSTSSSPTYHTTLLTTIPASDQLYNSGYNFLAVTIQNYGILDIPTGVDSDASIDGGATEKFHCDSCPADNDTASDGEIVYNTPSASSGTATDYTCFSGNTAPVATTPGTISQATDGTGYVTFSTTLSDANSNNTKLKVEYSDDGGSTWYDPVLVSATPDTGTLDTDNAQTYQIGTSNAIDTSGGNVVVTIVWNTLSASNGNGTLDSTSQSDIKVRVTPNDSVTDGTAQASANFSVDNLDPTISSRVTKDLDGDGYIDAMYITAAESVQDSTISASHFTIAGASGLAFSSTTNSDTANDSDFYITFTDGTLLTSSTANVTYTAGTLKDAYGNSLATVGPTASTDGAGPAILTAVATDETPIASAVDAGDKVTVTFSENTNQPAINATNVDTVLALNNSHSWKDGANAISSATWSSASVLVVTMTAGTSAPTVAVADTITLSSTITDGTNNASSVAFSAISGTFFNNVAPTVTISSAAQKTAGTGTVDIAVVVDDGDDNDQVRVKLEYKAGADCSAGTSDPTLDETDANTTSTYGDPKVENDDTYQVGNSSGWITTSSGANTVNFDWLAETDVSTANGTYCIKVTPYDGLSVGTAATTTLTLDNVNPTSAGALTLNAKTSTSITLDYGTAGSDTNINNYKVYYKAGSSGVAETDTLHATVASGSYNADGTTAISSLTPNTQYVFNIWTYDSYGNKGNPTEVVITTLANVPSAPTLTAATSSITTVINQNSNPSTTTYALQVGTQYVQANGALGESAVWQSYTTWGGATGQSISGLTPNTTYTIDVKARNGDSTETAAGSTTVYTLANAPGAATVANPSASEMAVTLATNSNPSTTQFKIYESVTGKYVQANGTLDTAAVWQTASTWGTASGVSGKIVVTGLSPNVQYTFAATAKNASDVETAASSNVSLYTLANAPITPSPSIDKDVGTTLRWVANSNPQGTTYYYVEGTSTNSNSSGWITALNWTDSSAKQFDTSYCYRVKAKNGDNVETSWLTFSCSMIEGGAVSILNYSTLRNKTVTTPDSEPDEDDSETEAEPQPEAELQPEPQTFKDEVTIDQTTAQSLPDPVVITNEKDQIELIIDQNTTLTDGSNDQVFSGTIAPPVISVPIIKNKGLEEKVIVSIRIDTSSNDSVYFSKPAVISFAIEDLIKDKKDFKPENLLVYFYNSLTEKYEYVSRLTISPDNKFASFLTYHLSTFVVFDIENPEEEAELIRKETPFLDIAEHWSNSYVTQLYSKGIVSGKTYTKFMPDEEVTRAEFLKMALLSFNYLVKGADKSEFSDIANDFWAIDFIETARGNGLVDGYKDGNFRPNNQINRSEALKILFKTAKFEINTEDKTKSNFIDVDQRAWYVPFINYAKQSKIVEGYDDGTFRPGQSLTRGEAAKIIIETMEIWAK